MNDAASTTPPDRYHDDRQLSDAAVVAKTGKTWSEWFAILDKAGAEQMDHGQIVAYLSRAHVVSPWWQQMVTVTYEHERIQRLRQEQMDDYQAIARKTVGASAGLAYQSWFDPLRRAGWLSLDLDLRRAIPNRSLHIAWTDGKTFVDVDFHPRIDGTCQVAVQHLGLSDSEQAETMKAYWAAALERLAATLSG